MGDIHMLFSNKDTFKIVLTTYGGEFCLGTTDKETVEYWSNRPTDEFIQHVIEDTITDAPDEYYLYPFFDQTDVIHTDGVILNDHNHMEVLDGSEETVYEMSLGSLREQMEMIDNPITGLEEGQPVIYSGCMKKGSWEYELELDIGTKFDPEKLKFFIHHLEGTFVIDHIHYDGIECAFNYETTRTINLFASVGEVSDVEGDYELLHQLDC